jgi:hypothetical protein
MTDDLATAMNTGGGQGMDGALETIESVLAPAMTTSNVLS